MPVVGANRQIEIAAGFVEHQRHPERNEPSGHPGIVVRVIRQADVDEPLLMQLPQPLAGVVRCPAQTDVACSVRFTSKAR